MSTISRVLALGGRATISTPLSLLRTDVSGRVIQAWGSPSHCVTGPAPRTVSGRGRGRGRHCYSVEVIISSGLVRDDGCRGISTDYYRAIPSVYYT